MITALFISDQQTGQNHLFTKGILLDTAAINIFSNLSFFMLCVAFAYNYIIPENTSLKNQYLASGPSLWLLKMFSNPEKQWTVWQKLIPSWHVNVDWNRFLEKSNVL